MKPAIRLASETAPRLPKKLAFTAPILRSLKAPATGRAWIYDSRTPGLAFMVTDRNARALYLCYRGPTDGRPKRYRLGGFPDLALDDARTLATKLNGQIASGIDPQDQRRTQRAAETFGLAFTTYLEQHAKPKKRTWQEDQDKYDLHLKQWEGRKLTSITQPDVQALHAKIGKEHPGAANRVLALLSKVFNFHRVNPNPAKGVSRFPEQQRERFLAAHELPRFFAALDKLEPVWKDFFRLCLLTGARRGNVLSMRWAEIDLDGSLWTIPAEKFKTNHAQQIPLVPDAVEILERRKQEQAAKVARAKAKGKPAELPDYVFPARNRKGKCPHLSEPKKPWETIRAELKAPDLRIHDLRRTLGSWQAATGANLSVIGKTLGHRNTSTTAIYARLNIDPVRQALETATAAMAAAAKPKAKP